MIKLGQELQSTLKEIKISKENAQNTHIVNSDGIRQELLTRLKALKTTGEQEQGQAGLSLIGQRHGETGAVTISNEQAAAKLAEQCVGECLPFTIQSWMKNMEEAENQRASVGRQIILTPSLTSSEIADVKHEMLMLNEITKPIYAKGQGGELTDIIMTMLAAFPFGLRHDESHAKAKIMAFCDECEVYPMYAVKIAAKWAIRSGKEPTLGGFINDIKLAIGDDVLRRQKILLKLLRK